MKLCSFWVILRVRSIRYKPSRMAFKEEFDIKKEYLTLGKALIESFHRQSWYPTEDFILFACAGDDIEEVV